jgi:hypothetical protein
MHTHAYRRCSYLTIPNAFKSRCKRDGSLITLFQKLNEKNYPILHKNIFACQKKKDMIVKCFLEIITIKSLIFLNIFKKVERPGR